MATGITDGDRQRRAGYARGGRHFLCQYGGRQREQQERNAQDRARRQLEAPLLSQSISFSYADAGQLQNAAEKLLSPKGSLSLDKRTNRLLVRDNKAVLDTLQRWATQMDIPVEQVELAAHIVTINEKVCGSWG